MPYDYDPNLDPNAQQQPGQNAPQLAGGSQVMGGSTATSSGGSAAANSPSQGAGGGQVQSNPNPSPTSSGSFQNLNSYLTANQGNGFGQQFVGDVNNTVNQAQNAQQQGFQNFQGASDAGSVKENQDLVNQAITNPTDFASNPSNVSAFQQQLNAKYSGPYAFTDDQAAYQQAAGATQQAKDTAQAAGTEPGRFALLNNYFGNSNYSQGQQSLDNLLIQGDPATQQGIQQAQQNANQAQSSLQNLMPQAANYAAQNVANTQATAQNAQTQGNNQISSLNNQYNQQLTADQAAIAAAQGQLNTLQNNGDQSQWGSILQNYGINPQSVNDPLLSGVQDTGYWGINPAGINAGNASLAAPPTLSSATTSQQQATLNALQQLMNETQTQFTPGAAGTFNANQPLNINSTDASAAIKAATKAYLDQSQPYNAAIQAAEVGGLQPTNVAYQSGNQAQAITGYLTQLNAIRSNYGLSPITEQQIASQPGFINDPLYGSNVQGPVVTPSAPVTTGPIAL